MNSAERIPVYLQAYATEEQRWRELVEPRTPRSGAAVETNVGPAVRVHPKDRVLFARIDAVLARYDQSRVAPSILRRRALRLDGNPEQFSSFIGGSK